MSDQIGYFDYDGTGLTEEILASTENLVESSVTIDATCRDTTNGTTTDLRRGLLLWPDTAYSNRFTELDNDAVIAGLEDEAVVLAVPLDISDGNNLVAKVYTAGVFKYYKLLDSSGYTLTHFDNDKAQRIIIKTNQ